MDNDVGEEITFSAVFPLPFRVLVLAGLGILAWATNLHGLSLAGLDVASAMNLDNRYNALPHDRRRDSPLPTQQRVGWKMVSSPGSLHIPVYKLALQVMLLAGVAWFIYGNVTSGSLGLVDVFKYIPAVAGLFMFMLLVSPFDTFARRERDAFLHAVYRCLFAPGDQPVHFSDVVLADVFTSYAKVIGDVWLSLCMLLPSGSLLVQPQYAGWTRWVLPTLMSLPYAIRFRQCIIEYRLSGPRVRRPMYNAIKYASAFPVIYLSAAQRLVASEVPSSGESWFKAHPLFRLWLLAAAVNSLYSFWWDVTYDWGFDLLTFQSKNTQVAKSPLRSPPKRLLLARKHSLSNEDIEDLPAKESGPGRVVDAIPHSSVGYPFGLRPTLLFPLPVYPFTILVDLVLRLTWSVKLSSHLHSKTEGDLLIFWIEMAELVRRWMWLFLRVEWEVVKERGSNRSRRPSYSDSNFAGFSSPVTPGIMGSDAPEEYELSEGTGSRLPLS